MWPRPKIKLIPPPKDFLFFSFLPKIISKINHSNLYKIFLFASDLWINLHIYTTKLALSQK